MCSRSLSAVFPLYLFYTPRSLYCNVHGLVLRVSTLPSANTVRRAGLRDAGGSSPITVETATPSTAAACVDSPYHSLSQQLNSQRRSACLCQHRAVMCRWYPTCVSAAAAAAATTTHDHWNGRCLSLQPIAITKTTTPGVDINIRQTTDDEVYLVSQRRRLTRAGCLQPFQHCLGSRSFTDFYGIRRMSYTSVLTAAAERQQQKQQYCKQHQQQQR